jgi:hypothetical protein
LKNFCFARFGGGLWVEVHDVGALQAQAERMITEYGGCLIEEFVTGREFTVLVAENPDKAGEPIAYQAVECRQGLKRATHSPPFSAMCAGLSLGRH